MSNPRKPSFYENRVVRMLMPLAVALLLVVFISGLFIYPFLFSAASYDTDTGRLSQQLLTTALVSLLAALVPALVMSFVKEDFSISLTLALSWVVAVAASWIAMLVQQISPLGNLNGSGVLNVMFSVLIGSVLSVVPAVVATAVCVLRRIIANLLANKKR